MIYQPIGWAGRELSCEDFQADYPNWNRQSHRWLENPIAIAMNVVSQMFP